MALNNGGGTITEYIVEKSEDGVTWTEVTRVSATVPVTGGPRYDFAENLNLPIRKAYTFRVAAVNEVGRGPNSNIAGPVTLCPCDDDVDGGTGGAAPQPNDACGSCATDGGTANAGFTGAAGECQEQRKSSSSSSLIATAFKVCTDLGDCLAFTGIGTPIPDCVACPAPCASTVVTSGNCQYDVPRLNVKNGAGGRVTTYTGPTKTEGYSGSITVSCNNGTLTTTNATCTPNNCIAQPYSPTNQACSYSIPEIVSGQPPVLVNTNTAGYSGQISVTCNAGKITVTQSTTCTELPCEYTTYTSPTGCVFANPQGAGVQVQSPWTGAAVLIENTRAGYTGQPYTGTATATCLRGALTFTNVVCNSNCLGTNTTFNSCAFTTGSATTYVLQHNQSQNYNSTNPSSSVIGTATALCSNGTTQWQSQSCTNAPGAPILSATAGNASAVASWTPGGDGGAPIIEFTLAYSTSVNFNVVGGGSQVLGGDDTTSTISGLTNNTTWYLRVRAKNSANLISPWSNTVTVKPCGTPTPVTFDYAGYVVEPELTLTWTAPPDQFANTPTLSAEKSTDNGVTWTTFATFLPYNAGQLSSVLRNLPGANGLIRTQIRLRTTVAGCGEAVSNVKIAVRKPCAPGICGLNTVPARCTGTVNLRWGTAARAGCPPVTGYNIECTQLGLGGVTTPSPQTYTGLTGSFSPVYGGLTYGCTAAAYNEGGESPRSGGSNFSINTVSKPGYAPVTVGEVRGDRIAITWKAAFDGAGAYRSPVTSYTISMRKVSNRAGTVTTVAPVTASVLSYLFTGLQPRTSYEFRVVAANACGFGPDDGWSAPGTTTDDSTPSTPTLTATADLACNATNTASISLSWTASAVGAGFNPIAEYRIDRSTDQISWTRIATTEDGTTTSYRDTEGTSGITYYYRVSASNNSKLSANSNVASAVAPAAPPGIPQNLTATNGGGTGASATISWSPPTTGGSTVGIRYYLQYADADTLSWTTAASNLTATSYTKSGLTHGKTYYFTVRATNTACPGEYGLPVEPPVAVTVYNPNCTCPAVSLSGAAAGGCTFSFPSTGPTGNQTVNNSRSGYSGSASRLCTSLCEASTPVYSCTQLPPSTTTYNCVSGVCNEVSGTGGQYSTRTLCEANCGGGGTLNCMLSYVTNINGCRYPFSGTIPGNTYSAYFDTDTFGKTGSARMYCNGTTGSATFDAVTAACTAAAGCQATTNNTSNPPCEFAFPQMASGAPAVNGTLTLTSTGYTGGLSRTCNNGVPSYNVTQACQSLSNPCAGATCVYQISQRTNGDLQASRIGGTCGPSVTCYCGSPNVNGLWNGATITRSDLCFEL